MDEIGVRKRSIRYIDKAATILKSVMWCRWVQNEAVSYACLSLFDSGIVASKFRSCMSAYQES